MYDFFAPHQLFLSQCSLFLLRCPRVLYWELKVSSQAFVELKIQLEHSSNHPTAARLPDCLQAALRTDFCESKHDLQKRKPTEVVKMPISRPLELLQHLLRIYTSLEAVFVQKKSHVKFQLASP